MLNEEHQGISIVTVPARLGQTYAAWVPGKSVMIVAADTPEEQLDAILVLVDRLLSLSASRDRRPAVSSD